MWAAQWSGQWNYYSSRLADYIFLCIVVMLCACVSVYMCSEKVYDALQVSHSSASFNEIFTWMTPFQKSIFGSSFNCVEPSLGLWCGRSGLLLQWTIIYNLDYLSALCLMMWPGSKTKNVIWIVLLGDA